MRPIAMDGESKADQDARVKRLWESLHTGPITPLDLDGLRAGLRKIEHPLAQAHDLLEEVLKYVDSNGNGRIEYEEFRDFVEHTEVRLWKLYKTIDGHHNGRVDKAELESAFSSAGLAIDDARLAQFFDQVDANHDGVITFEEWRNFLIFLPTEHASLRNVLSYYSSAVRVSPEGDVHVSDESRQGSGTASPIPLLFRILGINAPVYGKGVAQHQQEVNVKASKAQAGAMTSTRSHQDTFPWDPGDVALERHALDQEILESVDDFSLLLHVHQLTELLPDPGYFLAGGIAGAVSRTATAPLDRLKVFLIAQTGSNKDAVDAIKSANAARSVKAASRPLREAAISIWRAGGIRSLFAGNGLNVLKVMPESAIKFGSYEGTKRIMARLEGHDQSQRLHPWSQFFAAGMGGIVSQFAIYPLDTLKFRMQCETVEGGLHGNALITQTAKKLFQTGGLRSYYRGLGMGLVGMFPYSAIDLTTYEYLKARITDYNMRRRSCSMADGAPGGLMTGAIGAVSSSLGASIVYPLNLLRTRLQSQGTAIHPPTYSGWRDCLRRTIAHEGVRGLYRGLTPNLLKVVPSMSISYMVYEASKQLLGLP